MSFDQLTDLTEKYPWIIEYSKALAVLVLSLVMLYIVKRSLLKILTKLVHRSKSQLDDIILKEGVFRRIAYLVPAIVIYNFAHLFGAAESLVRSLVSAYSIWIVLLVIDSVLSSIIEIFDERATEKKINLKSYIQISKIFIYVVGIIVIIAVLIGQSPVVLLSGLGALTAVLLLVFRDTILSFVASLQISSYDLVKVGDWIEVPKYGADGDVIDIALHTVKVQNWDKTITVIPTHKLIEESFINWRGMSESGGRRIKRAVYIDKTSIKLVDPEMLNRFKRFQLISGYLEKKVEEIKQYNIEHKVDEEELINGRRLTNVGVFRNYIKAYLQNHPKIHNELTFLVRQLAPGQYGLPIEIYVFSNDTKWANYEELQSDIFDHILAVVPFFDLKVFQNPTGGDFQRIARDT